MDNDPSINISDDNEFFNDILGRPTQSYAEWLASLKNGTNENGNFDINRVLGNFLTNGVNGLNGLNRLDDNDELNGSVEYNEENEDSSTSSHNIGLYSSFESFPSSSDSSSANTSFIPIISLIESTERNKDNDSRSTQSFEEWLASLENDTSLFSNFDMNNELQNYISNGFDGLNVPIPMEHNNEENGSSNHVGLVSNLESTPSTYTSPSTTATSTSTNDSLTRVSSVNEAMEQNKDDGSSIKVIVEDATTILENLTKSGIDPAKVKIDDKLLRKPTRRRQTKKEIPTDQKNDQYWVRRNKNNEAAKKSREIRRAKESDMIIRTVYLEEKYKRLQREYATALQEAMKMKADKNNPLPRASVIKYASGSNSRKTTYNVADYVEDISSDEEKEDSV